MRYRQSQLTAEEAAGSDVGFDWQEGRKARKERDPGDNEGGGEGEVTTPLSRNGSIGECETS